jgi:hypothetical protein
MANAADYLRDIKPGLKARCYACHGATKQKKGLRLDTAANIRKGGKDGKVIAPGQPTKSKILAKITAVNPDDRMPPEGKPLTPKQIEAIREWIAEGARTPKTEAAQANPRDHWSFKPIQRPPVPQPATPNPIDAFINAKLKEQKITSLPPADANTLLRRVYLDLIGLPPTREQLHAFNKSALRNPNSAFEKVVDDLLASPQYGERWGRHWMDVWRYSDWYGRRSVNDVRNSYPHIWRWRDWIVNSLNADKGYDRMIMEMLAADEIAPEDDSAIAATGFIVRNWFSLNYNIWMQDQVEHTGKAFLGLTFNCALCHDHKYDPISQKEYFAFRAFFEPLEFRHDRIPGGPAVPKYVRYKPGSGASLKPIAAGLPRIFDEVLDAKTRMFKGGDYRALTDDPPVPPAGPVFIGGDKLKITSIDLPPTAWYPGRKKFVQKEELVNAEKIVATAKAVLDKNATVLNSARQTTVLAQLESLRARIAADNVRGTGNFEKLAKAAHRIEQRAALHAAHERVAQAHQAIAMKETEKKKAQAQLAAAQKAVAAAEAALKKESTSYTLLSPTYPKKSSGRRTALARWIASSENPLTARVAANHIWARHFRRPLAEPVYDFGRKGTAPTHPKLLDWLAAELIKNNWRMKPIHRLIVTSEAYKRASAPSLKANSTLRIPHSKDPDNKLLWRMNPGRAEAEVIRDSILHVAGSLDKKIGGPEIDAKAAPTSRRRALYFTTFPEAGGRTQFIALFDAPDPCDCYRRTTSIIPQQALAMANSKLAQDQAAILARKLWAATGKESEFITAAFEQMLTRPPKPQELQLCQSFLKKQTTLFKENKKTATDQRARESLVHSLFSHNDFITVR